MIFRFFAFFTYLPIFSIVIPLYSILNLDNLKWGLTRNIGIESNPNSDNEVEGEGNRRFTEILTPNQSYSIIEINNAESRI